MLKIEGLANLQRQVDLTIKKIQSLPFTLTAKLVQSPELPAILGQAYQAGVDSQRGLKPNKPSYAKYKENRFGSKKVLIATSETYNAATKPGFFNISLSSNQFINITYNNKVAAIQASRGRNPLTGNVEVIQNQILTLVGNTLKEILA